MQTVSNCISLGAAAACWLCDALGKKWAEKNLEHGTEKQKGIITFEKVYNTGWAAGSLLNRTKLKGKPAMAVRFAVFLAVLTYYIYTLIFRKAFLTKLFMGIMIGGAAGNLGELTFKKRVTDFILFRRLNRIANPADIMIFVGAAGAVISDLAGI